MAKKIWLCLWLLAAQYSEVLSSIIAEEDPLEEAERRYLASTAKAAEAHEAAGSGLEGRHAADLLAAERRMDSPAQIAQNAAEFKAAERRLRAPGQGPQREEQLRPRAPGGVR